MKKFLSVLLLFFILYQSIGYYISFNFDTINYKNTDNNYAVFVFSKNDFKKLNWKEKNKEFLYKKHLYDIKSIKINSTNVIVKCYSDKKETEIYKKLNFIINNFVTSNTLSENIFIKIFKSVFFNDINTLSTFFNNLQYLNFKISISNYSNIFLDIIPPPPKVNL